jgi:hypothetical protein
MPTRLALVQSRSAISPRPRARNARAVRAVRFDEAGAYACGSAISAFSPPHEILRPCPTLAGTISSSRNTSAS